MVKNLWQHFPGSHVKLPVAVPDPISTFMPQLQKRHYAYFWGAFGGGTGGLVGLTYATIETHSHNLERLFIILGSLLVPTLYVYYLDLRNHFVDPRWRVLVTTFLLGAFLSAPLAVLIEAVTPSGTGSPGPAFLTGAIEEFAKAVPLLILLRRKGKSLVFQMDGIILGAAAGMGFAALEDMLYGADAFSHGLNEVVTTVWARELLGPFGHGTWTAIVGGTIWAMRGKGRVRTVFMVGGAYLLAAALHGAWDWQPFSDFATLFWLLGVGVLGLLVLRTMIHHALRQEDTYVQQGSAPMPSPVSVPPAD